ncbi:MAG: FAD:protein FMN transferase [Elusimicrobia bacterium]|nr:FAD:protein FMN transferase [Elusimicrobiota bacterium]
MTPPLLIASRLLAALASAAASPDIIRAQYVMGTVCEISAYGPAAPSAAAQALAEIARWDSVLSLYQEQSEASRLNRLAGDGPFAASQPLWEAVSESLRMARSTGGAFDPTVLPLMRRQAGAEALVGHEKVRLEPGRRIRFTKPGMGLDFGGIGKGLALDRAAALLRNKGVTAAMINFGGQIYALGAPPGAGGWQARISGLDETIWLKDASISTSGQSEKPGHIVSPFTGRPVAGRQVSVILPSAAEADAWSTALFVLGREPESFSGCSLFLGGPPPDSRRCRPYLMPSHAHSHGGSR